MGICVYVCVFDTITPESHSGLDLVFTWEWLSNSVKPAEVNRALPRPGEHQFRRAWSPCSLSLCTSHKWKSDRTAAQLNTRAHIWTWLSPWVSRLKAPFLRWKMMSTLCAPTSCSVRSPAAGSRTFWPETWLWKVRTSTTWVGTDCSWTITSPWGSWNCSPASSGNDQRWIKLGDVAIVALRCE